MIEVSHGGGLFSFGAVDLAANNGAADYSFVGMKLGAMVFSQGGVVAGRFGPFGFDTVLNVDASLIDKAIDQLRTFLPKKVWREAMSVAPVISRVASSEELGEP